MSLATRLAALVGAVGADIKALTTRNPFSGYVSVPASSLTLTSAHHGMIVVLTSTGIVPVTVPATGLPTNFYCRIMITSATGWFRLVAGNGASITSPVANNLAVKTRNAGADVYAIGTATYQMESNYLTAAFLLGLVTATPVVAYSTARLLTENHTGNLLKTRRSSNGDLLDIAPVGGVLNTSSLTSFTGSGDGYFNRCYDQSGNGRDLIQTTTGNQPRIVSGGVIDTLGGKPSMRIFQAGNWMDASLAITTNTFTVGMVGLLTSSGGNYGRLASLGVAGSLDYNNTSYASLLDRQGSTLSLYTERANNQFSGGILPGYNIPFLYFVRWDGTQITTWLGGTQITKTAASGNFNSSILRIGIDTGNQNNNWDGNFSEFVGYDTALTDTEVMLLGTNMKSYYSIS